MNDSISERYLDCLIGSCVKIYLVNNTVLRGELVWHDDRALLLDTGKNLALIFFATVTSVVVHKDDA